MPIVQVLYKYQFLPSSLFPVYLSISPAVTLFSSDSPLCLSVCLHLSSSCSLPASPTFLSVTSCTSNSLSLPQFFLAVFSSLTLFFLSRHVCLSPFTLTVSVYRLSLFCYLSPFLSYLSLCSTSLLVSFSFHLLHCERH